MEGRLGNNAVHNGCDGLSFVGNSNDTIPVFTPGFQKNIYPEHLVGSVQVCETCLELDSDSVRNLTVSVPLGTKFGTTRLTAAKT